MSLGYMHGRWGLPLPHAIPIFLVHGKPVPVPKVDRSDTAAFEKAVDVLHEAVVNELQAMYDRWARGLPPRMWCAINCIPVAEEEHGHFTPRQTCRNSMSWYFHPGGGGFELKVRHQDASCRHDCFMLI